MCVIQENLLFQYYNLATGPVKTVSFCEQQQRRQNKLFTKILHKTHTKSFQCIIYLIFQARVVIKLTCPSGTRRCYSPLDQNNFSDDHISYIFFWNASYVHPSAEESLHKNNLNYFIYLFAMFTTCRRGGANESHAKNINKVVPKIPSGRFYMRTQVQRMQANKYTRIEPGHIKY